MYRDESYLAKTLIKPKEVLHPDFKDEAWHLAWQEWIYQRHINDKTAIKYSGIAIRDELRLYSEGRQGSERYKKQLLGGKDMPKIPVNDVDGSATLQGGREGWMDVNFEDIFSPAPKYMDTLKGIFEAQEHDIVLSANDESSMTEKTKKKWDTYVNAKHGRDFSSFDKATGLPNREALYEIESIEELEIYDKIGGFKLSYETGMEKIIDHTMYLSNWVEIKRKIIEDLAVIGYAGTIDKVDGTTGKSKLEYIDASNSIIEYTRVDGFQKSRFAGYEKTFTIAELRIETNLTEDTLESLANKFSGQRGNPTDYSKELVGDSMYGYDEFRIPVLYCAWKNVDEDYTATRVGKNGKEILFSGNPKQPDMKKAIKEGTSRVGKIMTINESCWIIGTPHIFKYGKMNDIPFDPETRDVSLPFHFYKVRGKTLMERSLPMLDQCEMTYLRLQNAIAKAPPAGLKIQMDAIKGMTFGNKKWSPLDIIKLYSHTGNVIYSATTHYGHTPGQTQVGYNNPIEELKGGVGTAIDDAIKSWETAFQMLAELTGIDRISAVSKSPTADQAVGVTEMALAATSNTLRPLYSAYIEIKESSVRNSVLRSQLICISNSSVYEGVVGKLAVEAISIANNKAPLYYGIKIEAKPTEEMKAEVRNAAITAMNGRAVEGGKPYLTYSEYLFIVDQLNSGGGIKHARELIAYKEGEAKREAADKQRENLEIVKNNQIEADNNKAEKEKEKKRFDTDEEIRLEKVKSDLRIREARMLNNQDTEQKLLDGVMEEQKMVQEQNQTETV